jgi:hypothetical protein
MCTSRPKAGNEKGGTLVPQNHEGGETKDEMPLSARWGLFHLYTLLMEKEFTI